jgi:hypothetical protein
MHRVNVMLFEKTHVWLCNRRANWISGNISCAHRNPAPRGLSDSGMPSPMISHHDP